MTTTVDAVYKSSCFKRYKRVVTRLTVATAVLWALMGSWLTANNITEASTEFSDYFYSFWIVLVGGFIYFRSDSRRIAWSRAATLVGTGPALLIVFESCQYSDDTFVFWKMKSIKPAAWQQMISELRLIDEKWRINGPAFIPRDQAPKSFDALGLPGDYSGIYMRAGGHPGIVCGVKSRRWGLAIGSNDFSYGNGNWVSFKRVQVGKDVWFFAGPDG